MQNHLKISIDFLLFLYFYVYYQFIIIFKTDFFPNSGKIRALCILLENHPQSFEEQEPMKISNKRGFDFVQNATPKAPEPHYSFNPQHAPVAPASPIKQTGFSSTNPFVFGDDRVESPKVPKRERKDSKLTGVPKWVKGEGVG